MLRAMRTHWTAEVNVAGDANALVGITEAQNTNGNELVDVGGDDGQVEMNLSAAGGQDASGLNEDAATDLGNVLNITNNGEETIQFKIEVATQDVNPRSVHFYVANDSSTPGSADNADLDTVSQRGFDSDAANGTGNASDRFATTDKYSITSDIENEQGASSHVVVELGAGETATIGFAVDLFGQDLSNGDEIISDVTIIADTDLSGEPLVQDVVTDEELSDDPESVTVSTQDT
jgi:hypothetical protein